MKKGQSTNRKFKRGHLFTMTKEVNFKDPVTKKEKTKTILETCRRTKRGYKELVKSEELKK